MGDKEERGGKGERGEGGWETRKKEGERGNEGCWFLFLAGLTCVCACSWCRGLAREKVKQGSKGRKEALGFCSVFCCLSALAVLGKRGSLDLPLSFTTRS